ncbi:MAG: MBL fold metallo-hydrolase [Candidatus Thorarchaeota archaeon]|jgi:putative mRNA 3-end processing factor
MSTVSLKKSGTGFLLKYGDVKLALDTGIKGETTLLSHSHSDHIGGLKNARHIIATKGTIDTWQARRSNRFGNKTIIKHGDMFGQIGVNITALNAGHVLGSTMFLLEFDDDLRVLYTGDFNNVDSLIHKAAKPVDADVLITEATYGMPQWVFPDRRKVYDNILDAATKVIDEGRVPLFHAYSLGKSQEAIALLQSGGFRVISGNTSIDKVCSVYKRHGVDLRHHTVQSKNLTEILDEGAVIISSSSRHTIGNMQRMLGRKIFARYEKKLEYFNLSGWTIGKFRERGFPLSAHSDFNGLLNFAKEVNPRVAYCFTENGRTLSKHLSDNGIHAVPLE